MIVRTTAVYSFDMAVDDYGEGERIHVDPDAAYTNYMILEDDDQDEALDDREGQLSTAFEYELHDGQLCAIVEGKFVPCEDDYQFECRLKEMGYKP